MTDRLIDFYIKGLPLDDRLEILRCMDRINPSAIEKLLEQPQNYPIYRSMGYTDQQIQNQLRKNRDKFYSVNICVTHLGRKPFFSDPEDTYQSAQEYCELLKKRTDAELESIFGCSWQLYVPVEYAQ